jgi:hypothetical protein
MTPLDCPLTDPSVVLKKDERKEYVLQLVRIARARCQLTILDLDHIGLGLKYGLMGPAQAVAMLRQIGADELALAIPPEFPLLEGAV